MESVERFCKVGGMEGKGVINMEKKGEGVVCLFFFFLVQRVVCVFMANDGNSPAVMLKY